MNKYLLLRAFLGYFLPFAFLLTAGFGILLAIEHQHDRELIAANEGVQIELARKSLVRDFEQILPDIKVLANDRHVQQFIVRPDEAARRLMIEEFKSFALQKRLYRIIRYLDRSGREVARVDYRGGVVEVTSEDQLQDKADRYYFSETLGLGTGELYISPIDLNVEQGKVEVPYAPTMRFAMPVYDDEGSHQGVLVLNYNAELMLRHFDDMLTGSAGHVALLNEAGHWIRSHRREREWGFMFGREHTFARAHPEAWQAIISNDKGQVLDEDGLFTYATVYPLKLIGGYSEHEVEDKHVGHHHIDPESFRWKIVSDVPLSVLNRGLERNLFGAPGIAWLVLTLLGTVACWRAAMARVERRALRSQADLHAKLYEATTDGVIITDPDANMVSVNEAFTEITGYERGEALGKNPHILSSGKHDREFYRNLWSTVAREGSWEGEVVNRRKDGGIYIEWLRISAITDEEGWVTNYIGIFSDITSRKLSEEELLRRAHHDPLTGLNNRLALNERLDQHLARSRRVNAKLALLYIDLDRFKPINDTYSHQAGDAVLRELARRLQAGVREMDTVARIGGDEFVVVLTEVDTREHAAMVADALLAELLEPVDYQGKELRVGASIGVALFPDDAADGKELMARADAAMYRSKRESRQGDAERPVSA